jgi:outer membrane protein assembly factor BamB
VKRGGKLAAALSIVGLAACLSVPLDGASANTAPQVQWAQRHFDAAHSGLNPYEAILSPSTVSRLQLQWSAHVDINVMANVLATADQVFAGARRTVPLGTTVLFALDRATGSHQWHAGQFLSNVVSGIATSGGRVFIATIDDHALRAYDATTGSRLWTVTLDGGANAPTLASGTLFVQSGSFGLYAIDPVTGSIRWSTSYLGSGSTGSPALAGGRLFTTDGDANALEAFDPRTGDHLWTTFIDGDDDGSAVAVDGMVFVGSVAGTMYAMDQATGAILWQQSLGTGTESTPAIANGIGYIGNDSGDLLAFRVSDGTELWSAHTGAGFGLSSPIVANGVVYASTLGTYAYDALNGDLLWRAPTQFVNAEPVVVDGHLYVADFGGRVWAFGLPS